MASNQPLPGGLRLRYGTATVFSQADLNSPKLRELSDTSDITVLAAEGEFYRVQLPDESIGYVYAHNVVGTNMPLTDSEQVAADDRAATAARRPGGLRGILRRFQS
jgi:hypothetical protein